ncbi:hypothetical protein F3Y22_tig00110847pilonHSYRG00093 [Hibiscus syriacus]|uniref:Alg9-like mannosyltransferase family n=1 Tax=Hibiscus syriacus TaxID=106335 RepID=A0A6A2ZJN5_HIBSY|nr:anther-specific protein LAT52-like [Hibiscus syriacus]KAE8692254.1 hypothetical protein F3Y22_tig00110847pilonHSYRG00093 [Hibiscus syriacus]
MAKACVITFLFFFICISSSPTFASAAGPSKQNKYIIVGRVYCDTCRVEFETKLSEPINGAVVKLECKNRTTEATTYQSNEIATNPSGEYRIEVTGDYEDSDCDINLIRSPRDDCSEPTESWRKARVVLTARDGISGELRYPNNLGFKKKEALPGCKKVLTDMGYYELKEELGNEAVA